MSERFRYLPCFTDVMWGFGSIQPQIRYSWLYDPGKGHRLDLAHPAGWDHAVRCLFGFLGVEVEDSASLSFCAFRLKHVEHFECAVVTGILSNGQEVGTVAHADLIDRAVAACEATDPAEFRREALCRVVCAALGKGVDEAIPHVTAEASPMTRVKVVRNG